MFKKYFKPKSMTFWTGISAIATGVGLIVAKQDYNTGVQTILGGLAAIGIRAAQR